MTKIPRWLLTSVFCVGAVVNAAPSRPDFSSFTNILQNNVFNTKRSTRYVAPNTQVNQRVIRTEVVALTGTMKDERGPLAFFDGSRSDYRKVLKPNDNIAGFNISDIEHAYVKLRNGTNELMLPVNMQLSREEEGEWQLGARSESSDSASVTTTSSQTSSDYRRRGDRGDRGGRYDRRDRRSGSDVAESNGGDGAAPTPPDAPGNGSGPTDSIPPAVLNLIQGSPSNGAETNILEILRRRREQEDGQ